MSFMFSNINVCIDIVESRSKVNPPKALADLQKIATSTFAAAAIASNAILPANAAFIDQPTQPIQLQQQIQSLDFNLGSTNILAEKVVREGIYKDYEIDVTPQKLDSAESTFKSAKETKSKKGKYTALLAVLVVGSFIIPMAQYFWYVRDDDSTEKFFGQKQKIPEPEPEPVKKKGWFN